MRSLTTTEELAAVYTAVVKSALDAVIIVDETGHVVSLNAAAVAMFGYAEEEALGEDIAELIVPPHLRDAHEAGMSRYRSTGEHRVLGKPVEMEGMRKDGSLIPVELAIQEVLVSSERYFTANLRDLSPARLAASEIERQRDALHQTEKLAAFGSLLAGVAHELNNPLSIVLGQAAMLRDDVEQLADNALLARANSIEKAAERCARIVRSFLSIARQRKVERQPVELEPLIDACIELLGYTIKSSGIEIERHYPGERLIALADPDQLQQIVVNLLINASQALEARQSDRRIKISLRRSPGDMIVLGVQDNGPGVPEHVRPRIFDPFFTTKPQGMGTGIGLSVSRGLAEAQGGNLELATCNKLGALFELTVPEVTSAFSKQQTDAGNRVQESTAQLATVLIVDDEPDIVDLIKQSLEREGYTCEAATSGRQAQKRILTRKGEFDAVVCDLRMPDMDGIGFNEWVAVSKPHLAERFIYITGDALSAATSRLVGRNYEVLEKPFRPSDIVSKVQSLLARR